jgi:hypothetical protein
LPTAPGITPAQWEKYSRPSIHVSPRLHRSTYAGQGMTRIIEKTNRPPS